MEPWEHEAFNDHYNGQCYRNGKFYQSNHPTRYETVPDSQRLASRKGDIIKFGSGYYKTKLGDWRDWFPEKKDMYKFWRRNRTIPNYAMDEYAFIANRYRWIKYKWKDYKDYGAIAMMATGPKPCRIRKYYTTRPFHIVSAFPHKKFRSGNIYVKMKKPFSIRSCVWFLFDFNLSEFIEGLLNKYGDGENSRDMFLKKIKQVWETNL